MAFKAGTKTTPQLKDGSARLIVEATSNDFRGKTVEVATEIGRQVIRAEYVVIATGSTAVELPSLPFSGRVISSTEALALREVQGRLIVIGAGYIGLELGMAFAKLGTAVTVVEAEPRILPQYDAELTRPVAQRLRAYAVDLGLGDGIRANAFDRRDLEFPILSALRAPIFEPDETRDSVSPLRVRDIEAH